MNRRVARQRGTLRGHEGTYLGIMETDLKEGNLVPRVLERVLWEKEKLPSLSGCQGIVLISDGF